MRANKDLTSAQVIREKVHEFETRIETALHYKIPYPRPVNVTPGSTGKDPETVTPVYLHSYKRDPTKAGGAHSDGGAYKKSQVPVYHDN